MNPVVKNIIGLIVGLVIGMIVNMALIMVSHNIIPYPEGMIPGDMESLAAHIGEFEPKHFIMPFLAHALGTLAGAFTTAKIVANRHMIFGMVVGAFFFLGGLRMVIDLPGAPAWFNALDLIVAYIPMAWLGVKLAKPKVAESQSIDTLL